MEAQDDSAEAPTASTTKFIGSKSMKPASANSSSHGSDAESEATKEIKSSPPSLSRVFQLAKPERPMMCVAFLLMLVAEAAKQIIPLIVANAYNVIIDESLSTKEQMKDVNYYMLISIIIFFGAIIGEFFRFAIFGIIGERMVARLRIAVYRSILSQEIAFFDEHKSGELVSRLGSDTTLLQTVVSTAVPEGLVNVVKAIVSLILTFVISAKLAALSIGTIVFVCLFAMPFGKRLGKQSKEYQDQLGLAQTHSTEAIGSMRTVQSFTAEGKELSRFETHIGDPDSFKFWIPNKTSKRSTYRVGVFKSFTSSGFFSIIFGGGFGFLYVYLWYGFYLVANGELSLGDLTAFQSYVFNIGFGLGTASSQIAKIFEGIGASGRVLYLLDRVPSIPHPNNDGDDKAEKEVKTPKELLVPTTPMEGRIEFDDVHFAYPSRPNSIVLDGFSLTIPPNTTVALVGSSGSGKSTIVSLLQRLYDVSSGNIYIDGHDIQSVDLTWLRKHIGYVQQEPQLFGLSIRDNLFFGIDPDDDTFNNEEKMIKACQDANAHDFIVDLAEGYDTLVGERGIKLSGGQKQRVAIARALLTDCRILLLDEATSALDAESEHLVQEAIEKAVIGRSVVIVAHRLSTIKNANQIVVMDDHRIVGVGTHDDLLMNCTKYQDLIKRQNAN